MKTIFTQQIIKKCTQYCTFSISRKTNRWLFVALLFSIISSSCNLYNPAEPIPAYIHIDKITLTVTDTTAAGQGSRSCNISDAWVYVDGQLIGAFEMPCTFPVLYEGTHSVMVRPGIKVNGIAATRAPYPFYTEYTQTTTLQKGAITTIAPTVTYLTSTHFGFIEDFEPPGTLFQKHYGSDTSITKSNAPNVFEGNHSGIAYLDNTRTFFECTTHDSFALPVSSANSFLEFNYKSDYLLNVSLTCLTMQGSSVIGTQELGALTFNASSAWKKEYLFLSPTVGSAGNATYFKVNFWMQNNIGADSLTMMLDNIKLIH